MGQDGAAAHCSYDVMFWSVHPLAIWNDFQKIGGFGFFGLASDHESHQ
jgi:hypothetical protein